MKKISLNAFYYLLGLSFLLLSACNKDDDGTPAVNSAEFMQFAAVSGLFEIQSSNLATQKSATTQVVEFAQQMIEDHTVQAQELQTLAQQKNVMLPQSLTAEKAAIIQRLNGLTGTAFDKDYMNAQVVSHDETIERFEQAAANADDEQVRAFANKYLPALRLHRTHAGTVKTLTDAL
jgi:putative membrane protein